MERHHAARLSLLLAAILFVSLNIAANAGLTRARADLTREGLYTVTPGTLATLKKIDEPITLTFFFSDKLATDFPRLKTYGQRVRDLLNEYAAHAEGRLKIEVVDPEPFSPEEDRAVAMGLTGAPTPKGDDLYFGLVGTNMVDGREVIPFFAEDREQFLEYDLTRLIYSLNTVEKPVVGVMTSLPLDTGPGGMMGMLRGQSRPFQIWTDLTKSFATRMLPPGTDRIPDDIKVLIIVHPPALSDAAQYAIDQFVLKGGRALVLVDPVSEVARAMAGEGLPQPLPPSSALPKLFTAWGVALTEGKVLGDRQLAQRVALEENGRRVLSDYVPWLGFRQGTFDRGDIVTSPLAQVNMASAGALSRIAGASTTFAPLIRTSPEVMLIDASKITGAVEPDALLQDFQPLKEPQIVVARIGGSAKSAFDGPPAGSPLKKEDHVAQSAAPIGVLVVADSDILDDKFWTQSTPMMGQAVSVPVADNGAFIVNAIDNLAGAGELIGLRSRAVAQRPFTVVETMRRNAETRFLAEERRLRERLAETERRLDQLTREGPSGNADIMAPEVKAEIDRFRADRIQTRLALREVQLNLRKDIDALGMWLKLINIALVPLLVGFGAIAMAFYQARRTKAARLRAGAQA